MEENEVKNQEGAAQEAQQAEAAAAENAGGEGGAQERKPREIFYERIRTNKPEGKYDDDEEEYFRNAGSIMDELEKKSKSFDDMNDKIMKRFNSNPDEAAAFLDYLDGMSLPAAIRKNMGDEALSMKEGDEGWDEYENARKERQKRMDDSMAYMKSLKENGDASDKAIEEFLKENGIEGEDAEAFKKEIMDDYNDVIRGIVSPASLKRYLRSRNYDKDIEGAREQGRVDGRNENIEAEKKRMKGSGLPNAGAGGEAGKEVDGEKPNSTVDFLSKYTSRR